MGSPVITAPIGGWLFQFAEQAGVTGSAFVHGNLTELQGSLVEGDDVQPIYGHTFTKNPNPAILPYSILWQTGRVGQPIVYDSVTDTNAGPVFAKLTVVDSQIDFLQLGQTLTQFITVRVMDQNDGGFFDVPITYRVTGANDAPVAATDLVNMSENISSLKYKVTGNDFDPDHGGASRVDEAVALTTSGNSVLSVASAFSPFLNISDVSIQRVNFLNNALTAKDSILATFGKAFQSLMTGQTALVTIIYQIQDPHGVVDGAQFKITVLGSNDATINGTAGNDTRLFGENDADTIFGLAGNDIIDARAGNDTVYGDVGIDTIRGGLGRDILFGQAGNDRFIYGAITESGLTSTTRDYLADFVDGQDKIYVNGIDANTVLAGNQAFVLIAAMGTATSAVGIGRIGWYQVNAAGTANDRTFLRANNDADALIEMTIELKGLVNISAVNGVDIFF